MININCISVVYLSAPSSGDCRATRRVTVCYKYSRSIQLSCVLHFRALRYALKLQLLEIICTLAKSPLVLQRRMRVLIYLIKINNSYS